MNWLIKSRLCKKEISNAEGEDKGDLTKQTALNDTLDELHELQGELPLVNAMVDDNTIAQIIANWIGIPVGNMMNDEIARLLSLEEELDKRVIGQNVVR